MTRPLSFRRVCCDNAVHESAECSEVPDFVRVLDDCVANTVKDRP
jgi:hypothetical protein